MVETNDGIIPAPGIIRRRAIDKREYKINAATAELEVSVADQLLDLEETVSMPINWKGTESQSDQELLNRYSPEVLNVAFNRVCNALVDAGYQITKSYVEDGRAYVDLDWEEVHGVHVDE